MELKARRLTSKDYDTIVEWWKSWPEWQPLPKEMLPENGTGGIIIEKENEIQEKLDTTEESSIKQQLKQNENQLKTLQKEATQIEIEFTKKSTSLTDTISSNGFT